MSTRSLGVPSLMIGINIVVAADKIRLNQSHYIRELTTKFDQLVVAKVHCPASTHGCLGSSTCPDSEPLDTSVFPYLSLVGGLLWATITRPDVAAVVSRACQHFKSPTRAHWWELSAFSDICSPPPTMSSCTPGLFAPLTSPPSPTLRSQMRLNSGRVVVMRSTSPTASCVD